MHAAPLLHVLVHAHLLLAGCLFAAAVIGVDPRPHPPARATQVVAVVLATASHAILANQLYARPPVFLDAADVRAGAELMYTAEAGWTRWSSSSSAHSGTGRRGDDSSATTPERAAGRSAARPDCQERITAARIGDHRGMATSGAPLEGRHVRFIRYTRTRDGWTSETVHGRPRGTLRRSGSCGSSTSCASCPGTVGALPPLRAGAAPLSRSSIAAAPSD